MPNSTATMDTCDICDKVVGDSDKAICSGSCGKMAHAKCLTYHQLLFDDWTCSTDGCRKIDERYNQPAKKISADGKENFTVKIWRAVLENLDANQLANARLVCRRWKRIIDRSPSLVDKLVLIFPRGSTLDKHCEMVRDLTASKLRFTRVCLKKVTIVGAASWWPAIGGGLNSLIVTDCKISIAILLDLLKATPGLKRLELTCGRNFFCRTIPSIDFKLHSLEEMFLTGIQRVELLDVIEQMCPRLRVLRIPAKCKIDGYNAKLLCFIKGMRKTLEEIDISGENELFDKLTDLNGMLLKRVSLGNIEQEFMVYLSGQCPTLEIISVTRTKFNDQHLCQIGDNLPLLTSLSVKVSTDDSPTVTFLNLMPELAHLSIKCSNLPISFGKLNHSNLTSLTLLNAHQTDNWFKHFPNLRSLTLINCTIVGGWPDLLVPVAQLCKLQHLELEKVTAETASAVEYLPDYLESLTTMEITQCELPKDSLQMLFQFCPKLMRIRLQAVKGVCDDLGVVIGRNGKYLKEVQVQYCAIDDSVFMEHIRKHCKGVECYLYNNIQEGDDVEVQAEDGIK